VIAAHPGMINSFPFLPLNPITIYHASFIPFMIHHHDQWVQEVLAKHASFTGCACSPPLMEFGFQQIIHPFTFGLSISF
jgi:hypothetical protein